MLKTTPFHERTSALCVSHAWRRWAGHVVASSYELSHEREYHVIRAAAAWTPVAIILAVGLAMAELDLLPLAGLLMLAALAPLTRRAHALA